MEAKLWSHAGAPRRSLQVGRRGRAGEPKSRISVPVVSVMSTKPKEKSGVSKEAAPAAATTTTTEYKDNWFDRLAINHISHSLQAVTGLKNNKKGYDSLIEAASMVARKFGPTEQQDLVIQSLRKAIPEIVLSMIRLLPQSKFTREYFALFTTVFFSWLIGPCEVKESEIQGKLEKNVVHIKKCRFLEGTNCAGMCTNMCKMPSQKFIKESLGMPINMVPNFEDMSCEMIFGEEPPLPADDPALNQPCYQILCKAKQTYSVDCSST